MLAKNEVIRTWSCYNSIKQFKQDIYLLVWYKQREAIVSIVIVAIICLMAGLAIANMSSTSSSVVQTSKPSPAPAKPINLSGTGQAASEKFDLLEGLATAKLTNTGDGHFSAWLVDASTGDKIELLANESGQPFNGSKAFKAETGQYLLDVSADSGASWTVEITQ